MWMELDVFQGAKKLLITLWFLLAISSLGSRPALATPAEDHTLVMQAVASNFLTIRSHLSGPATDENILQTALQTPTISAPVKARIAKIIASLSQFHRLESRLPRRITDEITIIKRKLTKLRFRNRGIIAATLVRQQRIERRRGFPELAEGLAYGESILNSGASTIYAASYYKRIIAQATGAGVLRVPSSRKPDPPSVSVGDILFGDLVGAIAGAAAGALTATPHGVLIGAAGGAIAGSIKEAFAQLDQAIPVAHATAQVALSYANLIANGQRASLPIPPGNPVTLAVSFGGTFTGAAKIACNATFTYQNQAPQVLTPATEYGTTSSPFGASITTDVVWTMPTEVQVNAQVICSPASKISNSVKICVVRNAVPGTPCR